MTDGEPTVADWTSTFPAAEAQAEVIAPPVAPGEAISPQVALPRYSLAELGLYFLKLGTFGFGGPIALVGYMQRDLVERRRWIAEEDYREGLALAQLAPGPLAAQLAIYLGWVRSRILGATLIAFAFILPSFLMVLALSAAYIRYGGLAWMQGAFYGIGAAVIAVIVRSAVKLVRMNLGRDRIAKNRQIKAFVDGVTAAATGAIAGAAFVLGRRAVVDVPTVLILAGTYLVLAKAKKVPEPLVILAAGVIGFMVSQSR
jgi:chromate transport protein ChrA